jgi:hypothetical protein
LEYLSSQSKIYRILYLMLSESAQNVDWAAFSLPDARRLVELARAEGVSPLLYHRLLCHPEISNLPPDFLALFSSSLALDHYRTAAHNTLLFNELDRILAAFAQAQLPVIVLKGAALARTLYPDPALRPMGDLDLLVKPGDVAACLQIAHGLGYTEPDPEAAAGLNQRLLHHVHLRQGKNLVLELHWQLLGGEAVQYATQADWFWGQVLPLTGTAEAGNAQQLTPLASLIYLSAHAVLQHGTGKALLIWFYDLDLLIRRSAQDISASELWAAASALGLQGALFAALQRCQELWQTPIPPDWLAKVPVDLGGMDEILAARQNRPRTRFEQERFKLQGLSWPGRLRLLAALIFPGPAYMRWRYQPHPAWLWPLYYIYRWGDVLGDVVKTIFLSVRAGRK